MTSFVNGLIGTFRCLILMGVAWVFVYLNAYTWDRALLVVILLVLVTPKDEKT